MSLENTIAQRAEYWATSLAFDDRTRDEIAQLIELSNDAELTERFYRDLEFGTGGLRGILGAGTNRMNVYNIRKASLALALYLKKVFSDQQELRVALSHDSRQFSREFAKASAEVFAAHGIQAYITTDLRPVPMLSFMVRHFECHAGVCVTASHNPPDYNGFKVYWQTGGQLVPPHDKAIIDIYNTIMDYENLPQVVYGEAVAKGLIREVGQEFDEAYFANVMRWQLSPEAERNLKIVYSPLHGAGLMPVTTMLKRFGFKNVYVVPEQEKPDGHFPTVKSPNPEDPAALELALALAKKEKADLVMATDPDCDRIGMVVRVGDSYFRPNGNQIGCLLTEYVLDRLHASGRLPKHPLVIKTVVTTDLQADIAKHYGVECEETLTGFKWICDLIERYKTGELQPAKEFVCGGEESYGFLADTFVRDKDGVISCCIAAEMVAFYKAQGKTLVDVLDELYARHGAYYETLHTLTLPGKDGAELILAMMAKLRQNPPMVIDGITVKKLRDFESRQEFLLKDKSFHRNQDLTLPRSNVLQFELVDGTKVSVRPSGTEPKIKFYVSVREPAALGQSGADLQASKESCMVRAERIEKFFVDMAKDASVHS